MTTKQVQTAEPATTSTLPSRRTRNIAIVILLALLVPAIGLEVNTLLAEQRTEQKRREVGAAGGKCETERRTPAWLAAIVGEDRSTFLDQTAIVGVVMTGDKIGDAQLAKVRDLPDVVGIDLGDSQVTSLGLKSLETLKSLRRVRLVNSQITDLSALANLPNLEILQIDFCRRIEAEHLGDLAKIPNLRELGASGLRLKDDGVAEVAKCTDLEALSLAGVTLGEHGLRPLQALKNLKRLSLAFSVVDSADLAEFQQALPECAVAK